MIKSKSMSIILAVVIFTVGVFCGLFLDRLGPSYKIYPRLRWVQRCREEKIVGQLRDRFSKKLDLAKEQKEKLSQILNKHKTAMEELKKEIGPKFKELKNSMKEEIKSILSDKQKEKFDRMTERYEKRKKRGKRFRAK